MPLQICAFKGFATRSASGPPLQAVSGPPEAVTTDSFTGAYEVPAGCLVVKIKGSGTIAWPGVATPEAFEGTEFRGVTPGQTFTVA